LLEEGKRAVEQEFKNNKIVNYEFDDEFIEKFRKNNISSLDDIYLEVAKGNLSPKTVVIKYQGEEVRVVDDAINKQIEKNQRILTTNSDTGVVVEGLTSPQLKLGSCCNPIPGDPIVGYVTKGFGIVVHHMNCLNLKNFQRERLINVAWASNIDRKYPVSIKIYAKSNMNLLLEIMNTISANNMSILAINANSTSALETIVKLKVMCPNSIELEKMIVNMKKIKYIYNIERDNLWE